MTCAAIPQTLATSENIQVSSLWNHAVRQSTPDVGLGAQQMPGEPGAARITA